MVLRGSIKILLISLFVTLLFPAVSSSQKPPASPTPNAPTASAPHGIYLVFPFENTGPSSRLDWLSEGLEELTIQGLSGAGEQVYAPSQRVGELERSGIPATAKVSRATMLHIAEGLDADFVVFGNYSSDGKNLTIECRVLRVDPASLLPALRETGPLETLMELHSKLTWRLLSQNDHSYPLNLAEFTKTHHALRLDAFEHYIRGLTSNDDEARGREFREASRLEPDWVEPEFALGEDYFTRRDCNAALPLYTRVPKGHDHYVESLFAIGVCRLLLNQPEQAEEAFTMVQTALRTTAASSIDFPEVLNNRAIARARQNKFPGAQEDLRRAASLDPDEDDYPFNLGLIALRQGDFGGAAALFREAAHREPDIPEDRSLLIAALEKSGRKEEAEQERNSANEAFGPNGAPTARLEAKADSLTRFERVMTEIDPETLRYEMESVEARAATSGAPDVRDTRDTPAVHVRRARQEVSAGRMDVAESEYRLALASDKGNAAAHSGLAEIARRQGKLDDAVRELQASLQSRDSAVVRTTLARVLLEQKKYAQARAEAERALKLAPNYAEAKQLLGHLPGSNQLEGAPKKEPQ